MKYPRSLLHGYDSATEKLIADALNIPLKQKRAKRRHVRRHKGVKK